MRKTANESEKYRQRLYEYYLKEQKLWSSGTSRRVNASSRYEAELRSLLASRAPGREAQLLKTLLCLSTDELDLTSFLFATVSTN